MRAFALPDLGEGLHDAEIVAWHVAVGDHVVAEQPLVSVETDKAVVEIPAPIAGQIVALHGSVGEHVEVGAPLVDFEPGAHADAGAIVGELPEPQHPPLPMPKPPTRQLRAAGAIRALPAVRTRAGRLGIDLASVTPTGPDSTITIEDLERAAASFSETGYTPLRGVRRAMALNMARAHAEVVPATVTDAADVDHWPQNCDVIARLVRAMISAAAREPMVNSWFDGKSLSRKLFPVLNVGLAVDTPDGLLVPVLANAAACEDLTLAIRQLVEAARARTLSPEALRGASITLSNFGGIGGRHAALVVMPPQVAILGAGRMAQQIVAARGNPVVHRLLPLSLTFDHRAVTGGEAARFLMHVIAHLEANG